MAKGGEGGRKGEREGGRERMGRREEVRKRMKEKEADSLLRVLEF